MLVGQHKTPRTGIVQHSQKSAPSFTITSQHNQLQNRAFIFSGAGNTNLKEAEPGKGVRFADEPVHTIAVAGAGGRVMKAFVVSGENASSAKAIEEDKPIFTLSSSQKAAHRAWLKYGHVVKMTPRALARFQSIPDSYILPDVATLAGKVIGNGIPPKEYQAIAEAFIRG
jgi:site-specific DNA-cytosine methylase